MCVEEIGLDHLHFDGGDGCRKSVRAHMADVAVNGLKECDCDCFVRRGG